MGGSDVKLARDKKGYLTNDQAGVADGAGYVMLVFFAETLEKHRDRYPCLFDYPILKRSLDGTNSET